MKTAMAQENPVDPGTDLPLHLQLRTHLRAQIVNHVLPPGTLLPSEAQLQKRYGVSRSVVRQALGALAAEGLIDRGRGRGSTVSPRREHHRLVHRMPGLSTQIAETGVSVGTEVLSFAVEPAQGIAAALGTPEVLAVERLRLVAGSPIAVIHTWLPLPLCSSLTADELRDASLHAVLKEKLGIDIVAGKRQVRAAPADAELLALLRMEPHAPVLLLEGTSVDPTGRPIEVFTTWHHADQVVFDIEVVREPASGVAIPARGAGTSDPVAGASDPVAGAMATKPHCSSGGSAGLQPDNPSPGSPHPSSPRPGSAAHNDDAVNSLTERAQLLSRDLARLADDLAAAERLPPNPASPPQSQL